MTELNLQTLWTECEALYPANKDLCLRLQDEHGVNVNLLLLALYLDHHTTIQFSREQWRRLPERVENWERKIVKPYRQLRRLAGGMVEPGEYQQMLDVELMMERKSQRLISHQLTEMVPQGDKANVNSYLRLFAEDLHINAGFDV